MMNFYKTPKLDALNEKFNEFENRFQLKLDEQNTAHKIHIQKLDDKIARLEEENSRTFELIDKLKLFMKFLLIKIVLFFFFFNSLKVMKLFTNRF